VKHRVPEGNSSTMQIVDLLRSGTLPDEERRPRNYRPAHRAVETHPLTDRPEPDDDTAPEEVCGPKPDGGWFCRPWDCHIPQECILGPGDDAPTRELDATAELEAIS